MTTLTARLRAHYGRRSGRRELATDFFAVFGGLWLVIEPLGFFFPDLDAGALGYFVLLGLSLTTALALARPKDALSYSLPPTGVSLSLRVGDLLEQEGNIIVGANDFFDTQVEGGVISAASVQGQLLQRVFKGSLNALDREIESSLKGIASEHVADKAFGKTERYPIATVAQAEWGAGRYFLPAFTRMNESVPSVVGSLKDLQVALLATWSEVAVHGQGEPVHAPVLGAHLARLPLSKTFLIQLIVLSFIGVRLTKGGSAPLTIWISPNDADDIDLAALKHWLRGLCAA